MWQFSPQNKECCSQSNFGTSDCLCYFRDNRSLKQHWLLSLLFKCLSICVFKVYVERQFLQVTKLSWFKLGRLLHKKSFLSFFAPNMENHFFLWNTLHFSTSCTLTATRRLPPLKNYSLSYGLDLSYVFTKSTDLKICDIIISIAG